MAHRSQLAQPPSTTELPGRIEFRLARNKVVNDFKLGRISRGEICDAQPELLRVAKNVGELTQEDCPICGEAKLVNVAFAFGARLPAGGRCLSSGADLSKLSQRVAEVACYVVEVCPECSWNHLVRTFLVGGRTGS